MAPYTRARLRMVKDTATVFKSGLMVLNTMATGEITWLTVEEGSIILMGTSTMVT
jgi:hypothetical protein